MLAPILITVYDRIDHLKKSIEALKRNDESKDSILYIISDGPFSKEVEEKINRIREYILGIQGFKKVYLIDRELNLGSYNSTKLAIETILKQYKRLIFLEDDIIVSKFFLKFMNESLEIFKDREDIFSICSYSPPELEFLELNEDIYLWNYYCPWGIGIWEKKWNKLDLDLNSYSLFVKNKKKMIEFFQGANHVLPILLEDRKKKIIAMDCRIDWNIYMNKWLCIYPKKSLSKNIGTDGSGEHCEKNNTYLNQNIEDYSPKIKEDIIINKKIFLKRKRYHKFKIIPRVIIYLKIFNLYNIIEKLKVIIFFKKIKELLIR